MDINEMAKKLAKELAKDQTLKGKTLVFLEDKNDVLSELHDEFDNIESEWEEKFESLSERMKESSRGEKIEEIHQCLYDICCAFEELNELIEVAIESLSNND